MTHYKEKEDILKRMIETIVVPKYPDIEDVSIKSMVGKKQIYKIGSVLSLCFARTCVIRCHNDI